MGGFFKLIKNYLQNRYQRVVLNNYSKLVSDWGKITHGVPQGSILAPLLFLLYINDLPSLVKTNNNFVLFTDDTSLIISNLDPINIRNDANKTLQLIQEWFGTNLISLNWEKPHFMRFSTKINFIDDFGIKYKDKRVTSVETIKFLGLNLDNSLSWKKQVESIIPKLSTAIFAMRIVQPFLSLDSLKLIYYSYFHTILSYGVIFWGNSSHSNSIFRMQKKAIRLIIGASNRDSC